MRRLARLHWPLVLSAALVALGFGWALSRTVLRVASRPHESRPAPSSHEVSEPPVESIRVEIPCKAIEIRLQAGARLRAFARLPGGDVEEARALLIPKEPGLRVLTVAQTHDRYGTRDVPPGRYDAWVAAWRLAPQRYGEIDLHAGEARAIEVDLTSIGASLTLDLGQSLDYRMVVSIVDTSGVDLAPIAGSVPSYIVPAGSYAVRGTLPNGRRAEASLTLEDGQVRTLNLEPR